MIAIHNTLKEEAFPNANTLSKQLEVSPRTIQRDMEFMRDQLGLPIDYDESRFGFYYTSNVEAFPTIHLSEGELLALAFAKEALQANQGTPYAGALATAFHKLATSLSATVSFSPGELAGLFSFRTVGRAPMDESLFATLGQAVLEQQEVTFAYRKSPGEPAEQRHVEPYHLASINGVWYLAARDLDRGAMRTFALNRMSALTLRKRHFKRPADFSPDTYFGDSFGPFRGDDEAMTVRIAFRPYAANLIRERPWHRSQVIKEKPDGSLELQLCVRDTYETLLWVLGWGDQARLLPPPSLVEEMRAMVAEIQSAYLTNRNTEFVQEGRGGYKFVSGAYKKQKNLGTEDGNRKAHNIAHSFLSPNFEYAYNTE